MGIFWLVLIIVVGLGMFIICILAQGENERLLASADEHEARRVREIAKRILEGL